MRNVDTELMKNKNTAGIETNLSLIAPSSLLFKDVEAFSSSTYSNTAIPLQLKSD
jgi:hypothetical protein